MYYKWFGHATSSVSGNPSVVYLENARGGTLLRHDDDLATYRNTWKDLTRVALNAEDSREFIHHLIKEIAA